MKLVTAVIKPFKLDEVREALSAIGVQGITVKRMLALIALIGVFSVCGSVAAQEKAPDQKAPSAAAPGAAPAAAAPETKAGEAPKVEAAAAPAPPDTPQLIGVDKISSGD